MNYATQEAQMGTAIGTAGKLAQANNSTIPGALELLSSNLGSLHEAIEQLNAKLYPLMSPKPEKVEERGQNLASESQDPTKYTLTHISALARAVFLMQMRVKNIYENIDL